METKNYAFTVSKTFNCGSNSKGSMDNRRFVFDAKNCLKANILYITFILAVNQINVGHIAWKISSAVTLIVMLIP